VLVLVTVRVPAPVFSRVPKELMPVKRVLPMASTVRVLPPPLMLPLIARVEPEAVSISALPVSVMVPP